MNILTKTTRSSSRTNKNQRGDYFRTDTKRGKNISPIMGWFCASGIVEILNVRWPFIKWRSKEGQVYWRIKLQIFCTFKEKYNKQVLCWYYILLFIQNILMPTIYSHIHLFRISSINQTWFRTCKDKWRQHFKNRYWRTV